jgi:peptide/nickel transport system substrate-binding protein
MPERIARTPVDRQIDDATGSGPYIFKKDEYRPGEKVVYVKNTSYVPRAEAPNGTAGGKQVHVDRLEWRILKDPQTQVSALLNGEVDLIELVPFEQYLTLKGHPAVTLDNVMTKGWFALHLNHLVAPFDNPKIARAALLAINQPALLRAQLVHPELYNGCASIYPCGSNYASDSGWFTGRPQFAAARALLKEAGYDGKPLVLLYPADYPLLNKFPPVMTQLLKQAGFNVDMQSMDWPTLVTRRASKRTADKGGWNLFITAWASADSMNPLFFAPLTGNGEKGWFGWATDEALERLKSEFLASSDEARRKELAALIQQRVLDVGIYAPVGEYKPLTAYRKDMVSGLLKSPVPVLWNLRKH